MMNRLDASRVALLLFGLLAWASCVRVPLPPALQPIEESLAGNWQLIVDPANRGLDEGWNELLDQGRLPEGLNLAPRQVSIPGPLEQVPELLSYDGVVWVWRDLTLPALGEAQARSLRFESVNHAVRVWLGGVEIGQHEGGYAPFELEVGALPAGRQRLLLRIVDPGAALIDGLSLATTPHAKESWYHNFGGVMGDVRLRTITHAMPRLTSVRPDPASGDLELEFALRRPKNVGAQERDLAVKVERLGEVNPLHPPAAWKAEEFLLEIPLPLSLGADSLTTHTVELNVPDPSRWSPEDPQLYRVTVRDGSAYDSRIFGFREVQLDDQGFSLNGEPLRVFGVLDQPHDTGRGGMQPPRAELVAKARAMKALGFNLVRAHVRPAWPAFLDACDALGLLVLEEPAIGWVDEGSRLQERLSDELRWMVERDASHPSLVMWGVLNELSGEAYRHGEALVKELGALDPTRPILEDSGGFFGARYLPAASADRDAPRELLPMLDEHVYPPYPIPPEEIERMQALVAPSGPAFVSEFGYGTLVNAEAAKAGFTVRGLHSAEGLFFAGAAKIQRAASFREDGWASARAAFEGRGPGLFALARMLDVLRANSKLQLITLTQWQGVSTESSAGVVPPWWPAERKSELAEAGERALAAALTERRIVARPSAASRRPSEPERVELTLINDTAEAWDVELELEQAGRETLRVAPGTIEAFGPASWLTEGVTARSRFGAHAVSPSRSFVVPEPPAQRVLRREGVERPVRLWLPEEVPEARAFAEREGFEFVDEPVAGLPSVALLGDPSGLRGRLGIDGWLRLLRWVRDGGVAVFLFDHPQTDALARLVGGGRGLREVADLPIPLQAARAAGNFLGRWHVVLNDARVVRLEGVDADAWSWSRPAHETSYGLPPEPVATSWRWDGDVRSLVAQHANPDDPSAPPPNPETPNPDARWSVELLGLGEHDDGLVSPHTMVVGDVRDGARSAMQTLGHFGNRLGDPLHSAAYGTGQLIFVGLPLLERVGEAHDMRRDRLLAQLVMTAAAEQAELDLAPGATLDESLNGKERTLLEEGFNALDRVVALSGRFSSQARTPERMSETEAVPLARALEHQRRALDALCQGRRALAGQEMLEAYQLVWKDRMEAFLVLEAKVLDGLMRAVEAGERSASDVAFRAHTAWAEGIKHLFNDEEELAFSWMGSAELLLREAGWVDAED